MFAEWQAYFTLEPFGPPADFWRAGLVTSMVRNVNRAKSTDKLATPEDFMPTAMTKDEPVEVDPEEMARQVRERFEALAVMQQRTHGQ